MSPSSLEHGTILQDASLPIGLDRSLSVSLFYADRLARAPNYSMIGQASHLNLKEKIADLFGQPVTDAPLDTYSI
ncbi:hypothetical protein TNCV_3968301 [Trichonephila clavipes]|nr:hypothetical protein TNCV_3968301 [Trichonephila clavipes]